MTGLQSLLGEVRGVTDGAKLKILYSLLHARREKFKKIVDDRPLTDFVTSTGVEDVIAYDPATPDDPHPDFDFIQETLVLRDAAKALIAKMSPANAAGYLQKEWEKDLNLLGAIVDAHRGAAKARKEQSQFHDRQATTFDESYEQFLQRLKDDPTFSLLEDFQ